MFRNITRHRRITSFCNEWWICQNCETHAVLSQDGVPENCPECGSAQVKRMTARDHRQAHPLIQDPIPPDVA